MTAALLVGLALAVRVAWVLAVPTKPVGDFAMYLESAVHVVEHGRLDPEFVYMPGYVWLLALVNALGGGVLTAKLTGAALASLGAGAVHGITAALWDRRAALVAGLGYALWPGGVAVASVTGTDMPAAALALLAVWALVFWGRARPLVAAIAFGAAMGLGAYVRAVALPLAAFSILYFRAVGAPWRAAAARAAVSVALAGVVLSPWAIRNRLRYGEWFVTDSHGGLTALVGANPNTDGRYSRSLNRVFREVTGYTLLAEPHRQADRASYALAKQWTAFSPAYALGLVAVKAERLLDQERSLLYWPIYRAGVLRPGGVKAWFDGHRREVEAVVDGFWVCLCAFFVAGLALAIVRRRWVVLAFVPMQLALVGIYALYFAEVRYHLPIAALMFPVAGGTVAWVFGAVVSLARDRAAARPIAREAGAGALAVAVVALAWQGAVVAGRSLRERHRWAAHVCRVEGHTVACLWRPEGPGPSPVQGVWDGFGLKPRAAGAAAATAAPVLGPGRHRVRMRVDLAPAQGGHVVSGQVALVVGRAATRADLATVAVASGRGETIPLELDVEHAGGPLPLAVQLEGAGFGPGQRLWVSAVELGAADQAR